MTSHTVRTSQGTPMTTTQKIAAIYARVSTEDQGKGYSIPTQIEACQRLAQQEGYHVPESHIFIDDGISGTTLDRPALRRLRELSPPRPLRQSSFWTRRLSRKMGKLLVLTDELQAANIPLLCVSHPVEYGPEGMLFFQMRGVIAEYEREKALERMHRGEWAVSKAGTTAVVACRLATGIFLNRTKAGLRLMTRKPLSCVGFLTCT